MSLNKVDLSLPDDFDKIVRLFPLPNLVLFPGVIQMLHLFEPRYRQLMSDALAADELISMAFIKPGWQAEIVERPDISSTICIGKIVTHAKLADGRYNLLLLGAKRAKIVQEIDGNTPYRMAQVELVDDDTQCTQQEANRLRKKVIRQFRKLTVRRPQIDEESLDQLLNKDLPLGQLIDLICYSSGANPLAQQEVLETPDVCRRAELALAILEKQNDANAVQQEKSFADFPPGFSLN